MEISNVEEKNTKFVENRLNELRNDIKGLKDSHSKFEDDFNKIILTKDDLASINKELEYVWIYDEFGDRKKIDLSKYRLKKQLLDDYIATRKEFNTLVKKDVIWNQTFNQSREYKDKLDKLQKDENFPNINKIRLPESTIRSIEKEVKQKELKYNKFKDNLPLNTINKFLKVNTELENLEYKQAFYKQDKELEDALEERLVRLDYKLQRGDPTIIECSEDSAHLEKTINYLEKKGYTTISVGVGSGDKARKLCAFLRKKEGSK